MSVTLGTLSEARFALIIAGDDLPFDQLDQQLGLTPTRTLHKGEVINRLPEIKAEQDQWIYAIPLTDPTDRDPDLNELLKLLIGKKEALHALRPKYHVWPRVYVQSDYAQMTYNFHSETIRLFNELGLGLRIASLSWGETGL